MNPAETTVSQPKPTVLIQVRANPEIDAAIRREAERRGKSLNSVICEALEQRFLGTKRSKG
jgi:predicted HicB family RNase H-like nuclease